MEYFAFQWHITDACDQRCKHCYIFSEDAGREPDAMTWPQIQDTFYNCLDFCKIHRRLPYFYLTGGDPILHPSFWDLLGLMKENKIPFTILGNPFHLDDEVCRRLKECGCEKYQLSLDGLRETHDWFRKPGSFDCTLEKIACIKKAGIRAVIMTTVSGVNIDQRWWPTGRTCTPLPATAPPAGRRMWASSPCATGSSWPTATESSKHTRPRAVRPISTRRTTCGPCMSMRRASFTSRRLRNQG